MATTQADNYSSTAFKGHSRQLCVLDISHEITTDELATNDVIQFGVIPSGATYVGGYIATDDLDGGSALVAVVGDGNDADGLLAAGTAGQSAGITTFDGAYITDARTTEEEETIAITVNTGAGTPQAGTVRVVVEYYVK